MVHKRGAEDTHEARKHDDRWSMRVDFRGERLVERHA
jgi:hypothetical protein